MANEHGGQRMKEKKEKELVAKKANPEGTLVTISVDYLDEWLTMAYIAGYESGKQQDEMKTERIHEIIDRLKDFLR